MAVRKRNFSPQAITKVLAFTLRQCKQFPFISSASVFLMLLSTLAQVASPLFAGKLVDILSSSSQDHAASASQAWLMLSILLALGLVAFSLQSAGIKASLGIESTMMRRMFIRAFAHTQHFSSNWHANTFEGSTVRQITRGVWAFDALYGLLLMEFFPCLVVLVGTTLLLAWHWPLMGGLVGVLIVGYLIAVISLSTRYLAPAATLSNLQDTRMTGAIADAITCNTVVKSFGAEQREINRFERVAYKWQNRQLRLWDRFVTYNVAQQGIIWFLQLVILATSLMLWSLQQASIGDITYVLTTFFVLQGYLRDMGSQFRQFQRAVNDMEEMVDLLDLSLDVQDVPQAPRIHIQHGEIEFKRVTFTYMGREKPLYHDFSLTIRAGERVGLVGHSGSGKTSFIKLIQRLHDIDSGHILIDGQDIAQVQQSSLRSQLAIVQQEPILFHRSLAENIAYARPNASQQEIEQAARQANAHAFISEQPKGYFTLVGERGVKLSGGERQRIAIARAFLSNAPILILDEATSSLDSQSEALIQEAIERLMEGRTTIVIAHRLSTVKALDRLIVMDHGKVIEQGTHAELIDVEGGVYQGLFKRQALDLINEMEAAHND